MPETIRSPLRRHPEDPIPLPPPPPHNTPMNSASPPAESVAVAATIHSELPAAVAKAEASSRVRGEWCSWSGQREEPRSSRVVTRILQRGRLAEAVQRAALGAQAAAAVLCLVAFSVLAADRDKGWALDDFHRYKQFRYSLSVNAIGFVYAGFQVYAQVHHLITEKHIISRPLADYLGFAMNQILAYLLISCSSSATARTGDWESNWGRDPFPSMANGSAAVSFLAFLAFAICALISANNLFSQSL